MHGKGQFELRHFQLDRHRTDQLLHGPEGAQPAAVDTAPPQQQRHRNKAPEDEHHRVHQEGGPLEVREQRIGEGEDIDHRELGQGVPANEHCGIHQIAVAQGV